MSDTNSDCALIDRLGGPTKVAELLNYPKQGGAQRVHNWRARGIPPGVKLAHPDIFLAGTQAQQPATAVQGVAHV